MTHSLGTATQALVGRAAGQAASPAWSLPRWAVEAIDPDSPDHPDIGFDPKAALRRIHPDRRGNLVTLASQVEAAMGTCRPIDAKPAIEALGRIGCRVQPGLPDDAAAGWSASTIAALSRFDGGIVEAAIRRAETEPFRFLNEVHPWLHERCVAAESRRLRTVRRLKLIAGTADAPAAPQADPAEVEALAARIAEKAASIGMGGLSAAPGKLPAWKPPMPETLMSAHGITREAALARIDRITKAQLNGRAYEPEGRPAESELDPDIRAFAEFEKAWGQ